ncbi:nuclear transport factor 2 family protein [Nocardia asteroides]|uniref:nuclear transport factor 2 family protein n=1 Tax=Nocardia asteroides TaxID=1824 RepID=UPI0034484184
MVGTGNQVDVSTCIELINSMSAAVGAHDVDAVLSYFDDECVFVNGVTGATSAKPDLVTFLEETWSAFPDYTPRPVASYFQENTLGVLFEISATPSSAEGGSAVGKVHWMVAAFSTFDPLSLKIVRDSYYVDEVMIEQKVKEAQRSVLD